MRSGDLMRIDGTGLPIISSTASATLRWKGENVATARSRLGFVACPGVLEAAVYGVAVPGAEGRRRHAAACVEGGLDLAELARHLRALPEYARRCSCA